MWVDIKEWRSMKIANFFPSRYSIRECALLSFYFPNLQTIYGVSEVHVDYEQMNEIGLFVSRITSTTWMSSILALQL